MPHLLWGSCYELQQITREVTHYRGEVAAIYLRHAAGYYGPGSELEAIKSALKIARQHYGADAVVDFGPKKLAAVREAFLQKGWSRPYVNKQVGKIVRAIRWAVGEELAPASVYQALKALAPLRRGHCEAPEPDRIAPADPQHVVAVLPFLKPHVRTIIELIRVTGMRPSEVCRMTLDKSTGRGHSGSIDRRRTRTLTGDADAR